MATKTQNTILGNIAAPAFVGSTSGASGVIGLVPAPAANAGEAKVLTDAGTFQQMSAIHPGSALGVINATSTSTFNAVSSGTFVTITAGSINANTITVATANATLLVYFRAFTSSSGSADSVVAIQLDSGTPVPIAYYNASLSAGLILSGTVLLTGVSAGVHTINVQQRSTTAGQSFQLGSDANRPGQLIAIEQPSVF